MSESSPAGKRPYESITDFDQDYGDGSEWERVVPLIDGGRRRLRGPFPHDPHDGHECHRHGHWSRDERFLIVACCGLDVT